MRASISVQLVVGAPLPLVVDSSVLEHLRKRLRRLNERRPQLTGPVDELEVAERRIVAVAAAHVDHASEAARTKSAQQTKRTSATDGAAK